MAGLPKIGVQAVVENEDGYIKALGAIQKANDQAANSVKDTAKKFDVLNDTTDYARDVQNRYNKALEQARGAFDQTVPAADHFAEAIAAASLAVNAASAVFSAIGNVLSFVGNIIANVVKQVVDFGGRIFNTGMEFGKIMSNISAVTKKTGVNLRDLGKELIDIGSNSVAGPMAVADAYYDVASGISDASISMDVLKASIATAEAGQANLKATTNGLISVMNSYKGGAMEAAYFSDVFTQSVNVGKGTMDEFVAALSPIASMAASSKIGFDELGGAMAFMTQKGLTAGQAGTALSGIITQLSRNTPGVTRALRAMGQQSIESSIANNGLAGTLNLLISGAKKTGQNLQTLVGRVEAMKAVTILGADEFQNYFKTFMEGVDEATSKAREIQRMDVSAQLQLISARFEGIGLSISQAVLPAFGKFLKFINESFKKFDWKKIGAGLDKIGEKLGESVGKLTDKLGGLLANIDWDQVASGIESAFSSVATFIGNIDWGAVIAGIGQFIQGVIQAGQTVVQFGTFVGTIFNGIKEVIEFFVNGAQNTWNNLLITLNNLGVFDVIGSAATTAGQVVFIAFDTMNKAAGTATMLIGIASAAIQWAIAQISQVAETVGQLFFIAMDAINQAAGTAGMIVTIASAAIQWAIAQIGIVATNVADGFNRGFQGIMDAARSVSNLIGGIMRAIAGAIIQALGPAAQMVANLAAAIAGLGGGGGGGNGTINFSGPQVSGHAKGGKLEPGWNVVGEKGPELINWGAGSMAMVYANERSKTMVQTATNQVASGSGGNKAKGIVKALAESKSVTWGGGGSGGGGGSIGRAVQKAISTPTMSIVDYIAKVGYETYAKMGHIAMPGAMPLSVGGGNNSSVINNNRNIENVNFYGNRNGDSAVERFARMRMIRKV